MKKFFVHIVLIWVVMTPVSAQQQDQYEQAFRLAEKHLMTDNLTEEERAAAQHHYVYNGYLFALSCIRQEKQQYAQARTILNQILPYADEEMRQRILPKIPLTWYFEGVIYQLQQQYEEALISMAMARDGYRELKDTSNEIDATCYLGKIKNDLFDTIGALEEFLSAETLARSGNYDDKLMDILQEQYHISQSIGNSELTFNISIKIDSLIAVSDDNRIKIEHYKLKGKEAKNNGQLILSEHWFLKNQQLIRQLDDENVGVDVYFSYTNLRDLYVRAERYEEALKYALLSNKQLHTIVTPAEQEYYMGYGHIANIYRHLGDSLQCFLNLDSFFMSARHTTEPREFIPLYTTRAICHAAFKDYDKALADYRTIDEILATKYDQTDGNRVSLLALMGGTEYQLGHYEESENLYNEYAEHTKALHGENSNDYINAIYYLANAEAFADHIDEGCSHYALAMQKTKAQVHEKLPFFTVSEREGYWHEKSELFLNMTPFAVASKKWQTSFTKDCYDALILSKSFLLASEQTTFDVIKKSGTVDDLHDMAMIAAMQTKIRSWETNYNVNTDSILFLSAKAEVLEKRLSAHCRSYGDMTSFMTIDYQQIKDSLGEGDVLIDFTDFIPKSRGRVYAAYLIDKAQENPLLIELFEECKIDSLHIAYPDQFYENPYAQTLYQLLWEPFKQHVQENATVYYVPSQLLFRIALESLPMEDGTLLGDHYHFVRLSSARELVCIDNKLHLSSDSPSPAAALYGGLYYDVDTTSMSKEARKYDISPILATRGDLHNGNPSTRHAFRNLPGTQKEIEVIEQTLTAHQLKVTSFSEIHGTEESLLSMHGHSPQILHFATHGFFYTPDEAKDINYLKGYEDAMSLSGLVLAGGNAAWSGQELPENVLGGILTAYNIARLDLRTTQLAVLGACQSGRGKATSEGLYGLQRAFKKAGVKTIVMSLWDVSDVVGTEFMTLFYQNLADEQNHWDKRKAFEKTRSEIRTKYPEPFYWAGFVMLD